ncbi:hypothetical protein ACFFR3_45655 [Nonomuraea salmonea]|uniref:Uncharacterized protein n=1 Tax=Nonomuraea salmonea TaxID=46181 RepID=A0ABV5P3U6_9ACTN
MTTPEPAPNPDAAGRERAAGALAQHAFAAAGALRLLAEHMSSIGWRTDEYSVEDLERVADSIRGMSIRAALASADADLVTMTMGKPMKLIPPGSYLAGEQDDRDTPH